MKDADTLYQIAWQSRPLMQATESAVEKGLAGTGLTVRMRAVLEILHQHGALTVPDLAHHLDIKRQYVQVMVNETLAAGHVEQHPNPRHKRSVLLDLTETGQALIAKVITQERALMADIAAGFDADDLEAALTVMRRLTETLKADV